MFSLLLRGFLWGQSAWGFAFTGAWFGAKATFSFSGAPGTGENGAAEEQAISGCLRQRSRCTGREKASGAASSSTRGRPEHSWEWLTPSKARSMAAVSSFLHLLSFSDIFPTSDLYYVIHWKCTEQCENIGTDKVVNRPRWGICHNFLKFEPRHRSESRETHSREIFSSWEQLRLNFSTGEGGTSDRSSPALLPASRPPPLCSQAPPRGRPGRRPMSASSPIRQRNPSAEKTVGSSCALSARVKPNPHGSG